MAFNERFDLPYVSGGATFGELVTSERLRELSSFPRDTLLDLLGDVYRGVSGYKRSGVVNGLVASCAPANGTIYISRGLGLSYSLTEDIRPVVNESPASVVLEAPDATHPRLDLIVARKLAEPVEADFATRQIMLASGVKSTLRLPAKLDEGCTFHVVKGSAAAEPTVTNGSLGDVPIAVVRVLAGAAHPILAADLFDVRSFLSPRVGGTSEYKCHARMDSFGDITTQVEFVTDPSIRVDTALAPVAFGKYEMILAVPKAFGTHGSEYFDADYLQMLIATADSGITMTRENVYASETTTGTLPSAVYLKNLIQIGHYSDQVTPGTMAAAGIIDGQLHLTASFLRTD